MSRVCVSGCVGVWVRVRVLDAQCIPEPFLFFLFFFRRFWFLLDVVRNDRPKSLVVGCQLLVVIVIVGRRWSLSGVWFSSSEYEAEAVSWLELARAHC